MDILNKLDKEPIQHQIDFVRFDFYDPATVRRISMKPLTDPVAFDTINTATKGGLHDPALGVGAYDKVGACQSCGQNSNDCTGHFGHIELSAILYNPFMLGYIQKLMKNKCFFCHRLRITDKDKVYLFMKLILVKLGMAKEATELQSLVYPTFMDSTSTVVEKIVKFLNNFSTKLKISENEGFGSDEAEESGSFDEKEKERHQSVDTSNTDDTNNTYSKKKKKKNHENYEEDLIIQQEAKKNSDKYKKEIETYKSNRIDQIIRKVLEFNEMLQKNETMKNIFDQSLNNNILLKDAINEFWKSVKSGKCPHCNALNSRIKKVGNIKFFQAPFSKKVIKKMKKSGIDIHKDALEDGAAYRAEIIEEKTKNKKNKTRTKKPKHIDEEDGKNNDNQSLASEADSESEEEVDIHNDDSHKYLHPMEIKEHIKRLWQLDGDLLSIVFGTLMRNNSNDDVEMEDSQNEAVLDNPISNLSFKISSTGPHIFFIESLIVPPNRFRPENRGGGDGSAYLHGQTAALAKLLNLSNELRNLSLKQGEQEESKENPAIKAVTMKDLIQRWTEMQDTVNILFDSTKASNKKDGDKSRGIKQLLEKKEGVYRTKMMGKRVNYAGRSVISPDPMIGSSEVGIPLYIAQKLVFAETVTSFNKDKLREFVKNGNRKWPGASMMINEDGRTISFDFVKDDYRMKLAENLKEGQIVYRHLLTGDILLVNRQPTLHKSSIMSHKARVLPGEKTIRLHYANCNTYNADFDGDEMNIHFLQNHIARQEAYTISNTDNQYIVPTSGSPIRGLIQDSVVSAVFITMKNAFFSREEYNQLVYSCLEAPLNNGTIRRIVIQNPTIYKPRVVYTGKQVITTILKSLITSPMVDNIVSEDSKGLNFEHNTRLNKDLWGPDEIFEGKVVVRDNEMLTGVLDKNHIGNAEFGLVHSFYEIYGPEMAGELISTVGRLFINYLQFFHGFTCGVDDILLKEESNFKRRVDIEKIIIDGITGLANYFDMEKFKLSLNNYSRRNIFTRKTAESLSHLRLQPSERKDIEKLLELQNYKLENILTGNSVLSAEDEDEVERCNKLIRDLKEKFYEIVLKDDTKTIDANVDTVVKNSIYPPSSECSKTWLKGLMKKFPDNYFSMMVLSGAKGSLVNHSQITCMLGQQELEGRRVPKMASGRTLPSFEPFDPNPRAGGFVSDRFSTGIRPQEFFFHCMAGREGLIDTAVKTSRSGYLQRCLVKHLEQLMVNYDYTVRDTDGNVIQFLYGEDSVDVISTKYLNNFKFLANNLDCYYDKFKPKRLEGKIDTHTIHKVKKNFDSEKDTLISVYDPWRYLGSVSEKLNSDMTNFITKDPEKIFENSESTKLSKIKNVENSNIGKISKSDFRLAVYMKYLNSLIQPGESVGILAAQSIGEPSTQMTLNTFHLAGHGGVNMTLGIPRLREILMTSEKNIKTPIMVLPMISKDIDKVKKLARNFERYLLLDIIKEISIKQNIIISPNRHDKFRRYEISISTENFDDIHNYFDFDYESLIRKFKVEFIPKFAKYINKHVKISGKKGEIIVEKVRTKRGAEGEETEEKEEDFESKRKKKEDISDDEVEDEQEYEDDNKIKRNTEDTEETYTDEEDNETGTARDRTESVEETGTLTDEDTKREDTQEFEDESQSGDDEDGEDTSEMPVEKITKKQEKLKKEMDMFNCRHYSHEEVKISDMKLNLESSSFSFELTIPFNQKNILLKNLLDETLKNITFKSVKSINRCHVIDRKENEKFVEYTLQLEGVNFDEVMKYVHHIDINRISTNDLGSILHKYGVYFFKFINLFNRLKLVELR